MNNYYQLLGVSRGASASVVKIAYEGKLRALEQQQSVHRAVAPLKT